LRRGNVVALRAEHHDRRSDIAKVDWLTVGHRDPTGGEIVADEEFIDDELDFLGVQIDVPAPPALKLEVSVSLGIDL
jgi:hypothetical protein